MCKKSILFVIPGHSLGGTTSSLASLLNSEFVNKYNVDVFAINRRKYIHPSIAPYDIGLNGLTTAFNADFSTFGRLDRLKYFPIKFLKQFKPIRGSLKHFVESRTIRKIECHKQYDYVVAFQEENTTKFTSHFTLSKKIAWIHCDYAKSFGEEVVELDMYNLFEKVVCVSEFTRTGFVGRYPSLACKTVAIHNLMDVDQVIEKSKDAIDDIRFDDSHFTILSMGRISEVKRFYLIPCIATKLKEAGLDFRWYILGGGNNVNDMKRLKDAIIQNNVEKEVICLGGKPNPYPYLKAADLMVSTSKLEACPMVFNEAKILHVPILSADFGSAYEFIEQGKDGVISTIVEMPDRLLEMAGQNEKPEVSSDNSFREVNDHILSQIEALFAQ